MGKYNEIGKTEDRPWGNFTILDEGIGFKVKRIEVFPGRRLSYQAHSKRSEHWFVVKGNAKATLDDTEYRLAKGDSIDIAAGAKHRVENLSSSQTFVFIETQTGDYLGEDDIERFEDDFGRAD